MAYLVVVSLYARKYFFSKHMEFELGELLEFLRPIFYRFQVRGDLQFGALYR